MLLFYLRLLEIVDQDQQPSEKLGSQIQEQVWPGHEDQVVLAHDQVLVLWAWSWSGSLKRTQISVKKLKQLINFRSQYDLDLKHQAAQYSVNNNDRCTANMYKIYFMDSWKPKQTCMKV